ncbi:putative acyl-CoA synthetase [Lachnellula subtilissima]|uniref:Putative acyl-CoA synthetase n=1 Tax=Lachnellula subtilissima TaxID=602034 RepID=A0A8H8S1G5_9HELO|nr:putative acyl-CoA synthetase [Lachnellula subtilissima]
MGSSVGIFGAVRTARAIAIRRHGTICHGKRRAILGQQQQQRRSLLTQSYAEGPTEVLLIVPYPTPLYIFIDLLLTVFNIQPPLLTQTIPEHFSSIVSEYGDRTAVISRSQVEVGRLTYRQLDDKSNVLARGLQERGVRKGDRVAVSLGNCWEFAALTYSIFKLGAILVPLNPAFNSTQVISALCHLEASHLIIGAETHLAYKPPRENISLLKAIAGDLTSATLQSSFVPSLRTITLVNNSTAPSHIDTTPFTAITPFTSLLHSSPQAIVPDASLHADDTVNIQFTSGTTSAPKAACLSHHSILNNGYFIGLRMGLTPQDVVCCPPPLFHCFGCILGYMATATHGSAILFPSPAFNPRATLEAVQAEKATALYGVATMFVSELELLSTGTVPRIGFEHLRTGIAAGSSVPSHLMSKLHRELNLTGLTICYGMTETSPVSCMTTPSDPLPKRLDSVGRLLPHVHAKVVSITDRTHILPIGERGELAIAGYNVMKGYWNDASRTAEVRVIDHDDQGKVWMHTGDEAVMDAEGYVKITGRIKDLIIRGGENIHPLEVENALFAHPAVSENIALGPDDSASNPTSSDKQKQKLKPAGVNSGLHAHESEADSKLLTTEGVREWVREQLSGHLVPKYVFWVTEYPKTASGKIQKFKLREMGISWLEKGREEGEQT